MAPYCAIPRDYLSDTPPLLRAMGFLVSQHGQLGAIPPPPFLSVSPLESMQSGGAIPPPPQRGISAILARYPMKTRQTGAIPPSAILSRKGIARYGGVSRTGPLSSQGSRAISKLAPSPGTHQTPIETLSKTLKVLELSWVIAYHSWVRNWELKVSTCTVAALLSKPPCQGKESLS